MPNIDGEKLKALRLRKMLAQRDLSELAGVATSTVVYLEHGERPATFGTIRKLAEALGVDPQELLGT